MLVGTSVDWYNCGMQFAKKPVAVAYVRVSIDKQGRSGLGLESQERIVREFCEARGLSLVGEFVEVESGRNNARPELAKALALARRKQGLLVIATLDRLGRRVAFIANLMESGVPFAACDAPDDAPFMLHVKAAVAEDEARKISTRTKNALATLKANGCYSKTKGRVVKLGNPANLTDEARRRGAAARAAVAVVDHAKMRPRIAELRAKGLTVRAIAEEVGTSPMTVSRILRAA